MTGSWDDKHATTLALGSGDISWNADQDDGSIERGIASPEQFQISDGLPVVPAPDAPRFSWHDVRVDQFFTDVDQTVPFTGTIYPREGRAVSADGQEYRQLYGNAVRNGSPLTMAAFERGLGTAGIPHGQWIVILGVMLFSVSTAIAWSY